MKRYIGNTGQVYIINDGEPSGITDDSPGDYRTVEDSLFNGKPVAAERRGGLFETERGAGGRREPLFGLGSKAFGSLSGHNGHSLFGGVEAGDLAIIAMLYFLYRESGDEEFLIVLVFFALGIFGK